MKTLLKVIICLAMMVSVVVPVSLSSSQEVLAKKEKFPVNTAFALQNNTIMYKDKKFTKKLFVLKKNTQVIITKMPLEYVQAKYKNKVGYFPVNGSLAYYIAQKPNIYYYYLYNLVDSFGYRVGDALKKLNEAEKEGRISYGEYSRMDYERVNDQIVDYYRLVDIYKFSKKDRNKILQKNTHKAQVAYDRMTLIYKPFDLVGEASFKADKPVVNKTAIYKKLDEATKSFEKLQKTFKTKKIRAIDQKTVDRFYHDIANVKLKIMYLPN